MYQAKRLSLSFASSALCIIHNTLTGLDICSYSAARDCVNSGQEALSYRDIDLCGRLDYPSLLEVIRSVFVIVSSFSSRSR